MMALLLAAATAWGGVALDRVEVLSDDPGSWLNDELPLAHRRPSTAALRLVEQVQPTWSTPWEGVLVGTSLASQSVAYERALGDGPWRWTVGLQTRLLLPSGALAGVAWRRGAFQGGVGLTALSTTTWRRPDWTHWTPMPTLSLAWVRRRHPAKLPGQETSP